MRTTSTAYRLLLQIGNGNGNVDHREAVERQAVSLRVVGHFALAMALFV